MKIINHILFFSCITALLTSCGSFGQGFLAGMSGMGGYGSYGVNSYNNGGNMDYLLNPNYAVAQTIAQQNQYNQMFSSTTSQTFNQVLAQEEQEYQNFCQYNKKPDGSNYTKDEWRAMIGQAIQNSNTGTYTTSNSNDTYSENGSSTKKCTKLTATDDAHCNGSGICSKCNGKKKYFDNTFGNNLWIDPCPVCKGSGKCPSCQGKGYR